MQTLAVIPARYASTRFPGKPLVPVGGVPMILRVWQRAQQAIAAGYIQHACVATDDERIFQVLLEAGAEVWMTRSDHPSGTDRLLEVADRIPGYDAYLNLQGDEPFLDPTDIERVVRPLAQVPAGGIGISTLAAPIHEAADVLNPNVVKVVRSDVGQALYFSRQAIPYLRDQPDSQSWVQHYAYLRHVGLYGFTAGALAAIRPLAIHPLEEAERLEQLRWLAAGIPIHVAETTQPSVAIDTPADLAQVEAMLARGELA